MSFEAYYDAAYAPPKAVHIPDNLPRFIASPQQGEFFKWVRYGTGNAVLRAVAGAGKTTTLIKALWYTRGLVNFAAYNKAIAAEIKERVAGEDAKAYQIGRNLNLSARVKCGTFHRFGFQAVRRKWDFLGEDGRINEHARKAELLNMTETPTDMVDVAYNIFDLARQRGLHPDLIQLSELEEIVEHFGLWEAVEESSYGIGDVIENSHKLLKAALEPVKFCDYTDMLWLPVARSLPMYKVDWVLVDEAQDTNPARRILAAMMMKPTSRAVFIGDPAQAIYGFTGADNDALDLISLDFEAADLDLTVTYRCPKAVVKVAQQWVSHIQAHESAPEGEARDGTYHEMINNAAKGDVILCRNTAPLVKAAFAFIRKGKRAHVEGRDIGRGLMALTEKFKVADLPEMFEKLEEWAARQIEMLIERNRSLGAQEVADKLETLRVLAENCGTVEDVQKRIRDIFDDTQADDAAYRITCSSVHRSKGREWDRVWWLGPDQFQPSSYARQEWEMEQEYNLMYVAATRAKKVLIRVPAPR